MVVLDGLSFPQTLARKELRFRGYSLVELGSLIAANALGIALAVAGFGVWSLIARYMAEKAVYAAAIWPVVGWRPARPSFLGVAPYLRFGFTMFGASLVQFFSNHTAAVIIGKFIGAETLGLYSLAYNVGFVPAQKVKLTLSTVLMPALASLQSEIVRVRSAIRESLFAAGIIFVPAMLGLAAIGPVFVPVVFGERWSAAGPYLVIMAAVGMLKGLEHLYRSVLIAMGRGKYYLLTTTAEAALGVPLLLIASFQYEVWGVLTAQLTITAFALCFTTFLVERTLSAKLLFIEATWRTMISGILMSSSVLVLGAFSPAESHLTLTLQVVAGVLIYAVIRFLLMTSSEWQMVRSLPLYRTILGTS
jgi:O-antigen/teichoic acid export membrane protein